MAAISRRDSVSIWTEPVKFQLETVVSRSMLTSSSKYEILWKSIQGIINSGASWKEQCKELKDLSYDTLSGSPYYNSMCPHQHLLSAFFYLKNPDPRILAALLLKSTELAIEKTENQPSCESETTSKTYSLWCDSMGIDPETMIPFTHGGGARYIQSFLDQENSGYAMEAGNKGIFITPQYPKKNTSRDAGYALRGSIQHFDSPIVLNGEIPAKYLHKVNWNSYEAVIFSESVPNIQNHRVSPIDAAMIRGELPDALPVGRMGLGITDYTQTLYPSLKDHYPQEILEEFEIYLKEIIDDAKLLP